MERGRGLKRAAPTRSERSLRPSTKDHRSTPASPTLFYLRGRTGAAAAERQQHKIGRAWRGLASGLAVIALAGIGLAATIAGYPEYALSIVVMVTPVMVFWLANLGLLGARLKTFLGDAGATTMHVLVVDLKFKVIPGSLNARFTNPRLPFAGSPIMLINLK